jgi:hypothetical protein
VFHLCALLLLEVVVVALMLVALVVVWVIQITLLL